VSRTLRLGARRPAPIGRLIGIVLVFVLLGPLIGSAVFALATAMYGFGWKVDAYDALFITLFTWLFGAPMAYAIGVLPAVAAGLIVGIRQSFFGPANLLFAVLTGLVVGALFLLVRWVLDAPGKTYAPTFVPIALASCLLPTIVCWAIVRRWHLPSRGVR
jgi:hypothetical protein